MVEAQTLTCPECGSNRLFKAGLRYLADESKIQRWLCQKCGYRFSDGIRVDDSSITLFKSRRQPFLNQICASKVKNLDTATETKTVVGEIATGNQTQDGLIVDFQWKMKLRQKSKSTIVNRTLFLARLVKLGADLTKPSTVESILALEEYTPANKYNTVKAYRAFTKAFKIEWEPLEVTYEAKEPFDPLEEEIDLLIESCSKTTATFLQILKDTGARCGEARKIEWTDIDEKRGTIAINHPEKGSRARTVKVSEKTLTMIKNLKKNNGLRLFSRTGSSQRKTFNRQRQRMAEVTKNPRLLKIHFHSLRHWRASREYEKAGDIYTVKDLLGHRALSSTDRYQHGKFQSEEYITKWAKTRQEEEELNNAGYVFVRYDHKEDAPIYRKRK